MPETDATLPVTAITASAELGGTERVLLDFANRAFEHGVVLRVLTPRDGPLLGILGEIGIPAEAVDAPHALLRGSQRAAQLASLPPALFALRKWSRALAQHRYVERAQVLLTVAFKSHLAVALARRHPVVWHLHEYPPQRTGVIWKFLARRVPDAMIANSEGVGAAWGKEKGEKGKLIAVIPNGVNLDRFTPRERSYWIHDELGIPHDHRLIGMPAVFARWKGQLEVIEAFHAVRADFPKVHLVFVGGSIYDTVAEREYADVLKQAIRGPTVHLLPFQAKIELVYPEFDVVLHYSVRPEPFGRVVVEAMACGVPIIAAAEGGPVEILGSDGHPSDAGWLVKPRDPAALADTLRSVLSLSPDRLRARGTMGRERAEDHFSARAFASRVAVVLRDTAAREQPRV